MNECVKFSKVSFEQFRKDMMSCGKVKYFDFEIKEFYDDIKLPQRATKGSAGYDFCAPFSFSLNKPDEEVKIPLGIRAEIDDGWVLIMVPRSSVGFKYSVHFNNTVGIIDSDYFYADNEGNIQAKLTGAKKPMSIKKGERFAQGILLPYGIAYDENINDLIDRKGGMGSTGV